MPIKHEISDSDKIELIDAIINLVPEIKTKRAFIINQILAPKTSTTEYVLEKIQINDMHYYRDKNRCILDDNGDIVGVWQWDFNKNDFNYYIFADEKAKIERRE